MKKVFILALVFFCIQPLLAQSAEDSALLEIKRYEAYADSVDKAMKYETGEILLSNGYAKLKIPAGFKFLAAEQSRFIVETVWGNPERDDVLGMIFPANSGPFTDSSYAFIVSYDKMGYVKDDDAADVDYDAMLKESIKEEPARNAEREKLGYPPIHWAGWAQAPFYDKNRKVLHWAKDLDFGGSPEHTLNYDVRFLGREGILSLNAVSSLNELPLVKNDIDKILAMAEFTDGHRYADYDSKTDNIAAYTVGGLVAGKVLAKVGFFAILAKFGKVILIGLVALGAGIKKFFFGKKKEEEEYKPVELDEIANNDKPENETTT
jgi:uncharacterized membrane-anchored protein